MGVLNFRSEKEVLEKIKNELEKRELKICTSDDWQAHEGVNFQVYVGYAFRNPVPGAKCDCKKGIQLTDCEAHRQYFCVAIYPHRVYEIEEPSDWWKTDAEKLITVIARVKKAA